MLAALLLAGVLGPLDAREIYLRCRKALNAVSVPPYVAFTYDDESTGSLGTMHTSGTERLRIVVRTSDGHAFVQTLRLQTGFQGRIAPVVVGDNAIFPYTGIYRLGDFPTAAFGLRQISRPGFLEAPAVLAPSKGSLRVLATVEAIDLPYRLTRLADDVIDGRPAYHLRLQPLRNPQHNVLRELWVDRTTFEPRRYEAIRYVGRPLDFSYLVTIDTSHIAGQLINTGLRGHFSKEVKQSLAEDGRPTFDWAPRVFYNDVAWTISDVSFPGTLPDWLFNPDTYAAHKKDALPLAFAAVGIPPALPVIRHLVFAYAIDRKPTQETRIPAGVDSADRDRETTGTITINVVAAFDDGALVVDVSPTQDRSLTFARVAISANGDLSYDARIHLISEQVALLRLLGRNVIGSGQRRSGESWSLVQNDNGTTSVTDFNLVDAATANETIRINDTVSEHETPRGEASWRGLVDYDPALLVPERASFVYPTRTSEGEVNRAIVLTLSQDSFTRPARVSGP